MKRTGAQPAEVDIYSDLGTSAHVVVPALEISILEQKGPVW